MKGAAQFWQKHFAKDLPNTKYLPKQLAKYLGSNGLHIVHPGGARDVLLHCSPGSFHSYQNECVGSDNYSARKNKTENKENDSVRHGHDVYVGGTPVNAASCAIGLLSIFSPVSKG